MSLKKVLVVDDEKRIVEIVQAYLEREGFQAVAALNGTTALELARKKLDHSIIIQLFKKLELSLIKKGFFAIGVNFPYTLRSMNG